jgi:hypothetical protein
VQDDQDGPDLWGVPILIAGAGMEPLAKQVGVGEAEGYGLQRRMNRQERPEPWKVEPAGGGEQDDADKRLKRGDLEEGGEGVSNGDSRAAPAWLPRVAIVLY